MGVRTCRQQCGRCTRPCAVACASRVSKAVGTGRASRRPQPRSAHLSRHHGTGGKPARRAAAVARRRPLLPLPLTPRAEARPEPEVPRHAVGAFLPSHGRTGGGAEGGASGAAAGAGCRRGGGGGGGRWGPGGAAVGSRPGASQMQSSLINQPDWLEQR